MEKVELCICLACLSFSYVPEKSWIGEKIKTLNCIYLSLFLFSSYLVYIPNITLQYTNIFKVIKIANTIINFSYTKGSLNCFPAFISEKILHTKSVRFCSHFVSEAISNILSVESQFSSWLAFQYLIWPCNTAEDKSLYLTFMPNK